MMLQLDGNGTAYVLFDGYAIIPREELDRLMVKAGEAVYPLWSEGSHWTGARNEGV